MNIIVCIKQVPDPETPTASFRIDTNTNKVIPAPNLAPVVSPFDENAVEAALQIKDKHGGKITAITLGPKSARDALKHAMSMGVDEGVLLDDPAFEGADSYATAYALARAIEKIGEYDLIFCGRQAADTDAGVVGCGIAEFLGIPSLTLIKKVEVVDGKIRAERLLADGFEVLELPTPALLTISNEVGVPRYPTLRGIMAAAKKEVTVWGPQDIGADPTRLGVAGSLTRLLKLYIPVREGKCEILEGDTPAEAAAKLALRLREAKII